MGALRRERHVTQATHTWAHLRMAAPSRVSNVRNWLLADYSASWVECPVLANKRTSMHCTEPDPQWIRHHVAQASSHGSGFNGHGRVNQNKSPAEAGSREPCRPVLARARVSSSPTMRLPLLLITSHYAALLQTGAGGGDEIEAPYPKSRVVASRICKGGGGFGRGGERFWRLGWRKEVG